MLLPDPGRKRGDWNHSKYYVEPTSVVVRGKWRDSSLKRLLLVSLWQTDNKFLDVLARTMGQCYVPYEKSCAQISETYTGGICLAGTSFDVRFFEQAGILFSSGTLCNVFHIICNNNHADIYQSARNLRPALQPSTTSKSASSVSLAQITESLLTRSTPRRTVLKSVSDTLLLHQNYRMRLML